MIWEGFVGYQTFCLDVFCVLIIAPQWRSESFEYGQADPCRHAPIDAQYNYGLLLALKISPLSPCSSCYIHSAANSARSAFSSRPYLPAIVTKNGSQWLVSTSTTAAPSCINR